MSASPGFLDLLEDLLRPLGPISVRRMFGGAGVYCDGVVFAFVDGDQLFLKTDAAGQAAYLAEGMGPFTYMTKHGPGTLMSYWRAPERLLDEPDEMVDWARTALGVARRAGIKAPRAGKRAAKPAAKAARKKPAANKKTAKKSGRRGRKTAAR